MGDNKEEENFDYSGVDFGTQPEWGKKIAPYFIIPQRLILAGFGFLAVLSAYIMRIGISTAITRMVPLRNYTSDGNKTSVAVCEPWDKFVVDDEIKAEYTQTEIFDWTQEQQGFILSSFYAGYILGHLPAGLLSEMFGGKWVLGLCILGSGILSILLPAATHLGGAWAVGIMRILIGLTQGGLFPSLNSLLARWVPLRERGILGAFVLGSGQLGTIIANVSSGYLLDRYHWKYVYYVDGSLGIVWFLFFILLCYNDPRSHPYIKRSEQEYLYREMKSVGRAKDLPMFPWGEVFRSRVFQSLLSAQVAHDWTYFIIVTDLPKYMNDVMQFPIKENGIISSMPPLLMWIMTILFGYIADRIISKKLLTIGGTRKLSTIVAAIIPSSLLVFASYAGCHHLLVIIFFTLGMGFMAGYFSGIKLSALDITPNYAGTVNALVNGFGAITGVIGPTTVGWMTPNTTLEEWRFVFWVAYFVRNGFAIPFIIYGTGEVQEWDDVRALEAKRASQKSV